VKPLNPWLYLQQLRSTRHLRGEATVRALRLAWALPADTTRRLRPLVSATATTATVVVRRGRLRGLGLDTVRQPV